MVCVCVCVCEETTRYKVEPKKGDGVLEHIVKRLAIADLAGIEQQNAGVDVR
jgi:hypothetical protein